MAEKRSSALSILLRDQRKTLVKIDLFDAREWDAKTEGYRLRENGTWVRDNGKYTYFTLPALGTYLRWKLAQCLGSADITDPKEPRIQPGAFVRVMRYDMTCRGLAHGHGQGGGAADTRHRRQVVRPGGRPLRW